MNAKIDLTKMIKKLISAIFITFLLTSCIDKKLNKENSGSGVEMKTDTLNKNKFENQPNKKDFDGFKFALQGRWQQTTYPFGTLEFDGDKIKIEEGEGASKPAKFNNFTLSDTCRFSKKDKSSYQDYIIIDGQKECTAIKISREALWMTFAGTSNKIVYTRIQNEIPTENFISQNMQGIWVLDKKDCGKNSKNQIIISKNTVSYFDKTYSLDGITEYEPTRIVANFHDEKNSNNKGKFILTVDLQKNGTQLIMREDGENAIPGVFQYFRCN